jgi:hypothetical protein
MEQLPTFYRLPAVNAVFERKDFSEQFSRGVFLPLNDCFRRLEDLPLHLVLRQTLSMSA